MWHHLVVEYGHQVAAGNDAGRLQWAPRTDWRFNVK